MFVDVINSPRAEWDLVNEKSGFTTDPPTGLAAHVAWESAPGEVTAVMVWDTPGARGDFAAEVMMPLFESGQLEGVTSNPDHFPPVFFYVRDEPPTDA